MKVQKKLTLVIIMVLFTIVALGTTTYAWFTLANTAKVEQIEMGITSGVGIEVSLDGTNWYNKLDDKLIENVVKDKKLDAVTTTDGKTMVLMDGKSSANVASYIQFKLYFRVKNVNTASKGFGIYLTNYGTDNGTKLTSKGVEWTPDVNYKDYDGTNDVDKKTTDTKATYKVENSMRVSFVDTDISNGTKVFILDQKSTDTKRGYAQTYGTTAEKKKVAYGAYSYYQVKTNSDASLPENAPKPTYTEVYSDKLTTITGESVTSDNNSLIAKLSSVSGTDYYTGSATITVWAEGWDIDCFDAVLKDHMDLQMQFQFGVIHE